MNKGDTLTLTFELLELYPSSPAWLHASGPIDLSSSDLFVYDHMIPETSTIAITDLVSGVSSPKILTYNSTLLYKNGTNSKK